MATTGSDKEPGINCGILSKGKEAMSNMNTIGIPSVDQFSKKVQSNGGKILQPKIPIPGVGWFAVA
jgi:predicted enzyme related to lactoylglutathione lyase